MHFDDNGHEDSENVVGGDDDDHEHSDGEDLYDKVELHVELSAHKKVKYCVHHLFVFHLGEVILGAYISYLRLIFY